MMMRFYLHFFLGLLAATSFGESKSKNNHQNEDRSSRDISEYYPSYADSVFGSGQYDELEMHHRHKRAAPACSAVDGCKKQVLRLPDGYNFFEIPFPPLFGKERDVGINVTMKARVEGIRGIDEVKEEITLDMEITLGWTDWKLLAHRKNLSEADVKQFILDGKHMERSNNLITINNPEYLKSIWKPNLYIYNLIEKTQPKLMSDLITLKYDPDGGFIFYLTRVILKLSCPMEFHYYPADTQTCQFLIRGFSYNEKLLNLMWYKNPYLADRDESNFDVQLSNYEFLKLKLREETYNGLSFHLTLRRKLSFHIVQTYIPSSFFILITWLCFLIPSTMVEARIGISMTTLLTLTAMFASVRETSPISSYVKALDIWMVSCIFSVFLTLFEFTILTWLRHLRNERVQNAQQKAKKEAKDRSHRAGVIELAGMMHNIKAHPRMNDNNGNGTGSEAEMDEEAREADKDQFDTYVGFIEKSAFAVFFLLFVIYNAVYWSWLFTSSEYYDLAEVNTTLNVADP